MSDELLGSKLVVINLETGVSGALTDWDPNAPLAMPAEWGKTNLITLASNPKAKVTIEDVVISRKSQRAISGVSAKNGDILFDHAYQKNRSVGRDFFVTSAGILAVDSLGHVALHRVADYSEIWNWSCAEQQVGIPPTQREFPAVYEYEGTLWLGINTGNASSFLIAFTTATGKVRHKCDVVFMLGAKLVEDHSLLLRSSLQYPVLNFKTGRIEKSLPRLCSVSDSYIWKKQFFIEVGLEGLLCVDWASRKTVWRFDVPKDHNFSEYAHSSGNGGISYASQLCDFSIRGSMAKFQFSEYKRLFNYFK